MIQKIRSLFGLKAFKESVTRDCENCFREVVPQPRIVFLNKGNGRSAATEFAGESYAACSFFQPQEQQTFVELSFDDSKGNFNEQLHKLDQASMYSNHYRGVIGIEAEALALHRDSIDYKNFLKAVREMCHYAAVLLFFPEKPSKDERALIQALKLPSECIPADPYTEQEKYEVFIEALGNVDIQEPDQFRLDAEAILSEKTDMTAVTEAAKMLLFHADRSEYKGIPLLKPQTLQFLNGGNES